MLDNLKKLIVFFVLLMISQLFFAQNSSNKIFEDDLKSHLKANHN